MKILKTPEFIQSIIRFAIGALTYFYISTGIDSGHFETTYEFLYIFSSSFFLISIINLVSIFWVQNSTPRRYTALVFDISSTTLSSFLTGGINSVFVLVYLWIYIGYGARYGLNFLTTAVACTLIGYNTLILTEDAWHLLTLEAVAFLLLIIALPAYLYSLQKKLTTTAELADSNNLEKSEFLATMTYQIRSPIGGIIGMIDLLNKTDLDLQQKQYLQSLSQSSHSLQEIIDDVIDFSRIEEGDIHLNNSDVNPRTLIDSLIHSLAPLGYEKQIELISYIDASFPDSVAIDAQRFRQLLSNLVRYVIEHGSSNEIYIHAYAGSINSHKQRNVCIEIQFKQNDNAHTFKSNTIPNTNEALPLRIAYQLTRLMNGLFEVKYNDQQQITFNLHFNWQENSNHTTLPNNILQEKRVLIYETCDLNKKVLADYCEQLQMDVYATSGIDNFIAHILWSNKKDKTFDLIIVGEGRYHNDCHELISRIRHETQSSAPILYTSYMHSIEHIEADSLQGIQATIIKPVSLEILKTQLIKLISPEPKTVTDTQPTTRALNILVAEDNEINASVVYSHLTDMGHNVDIATDGTTALYAIHKHHYHLVLMDISMPNMDGIEATRQWRRLEKDKPRLPIIALTARSTSADKARCLEAGMDDFLNKPVYEKQLREIINTYCSTPPSE